MKRTAFTAFAVITAFSCGKDFGRQSPSGHRQPRPDALPSLLPNSQPFRYPPELYTSKVEGNVMLSLYIDRDGKVVPDSTRLFKASGYPALDTAALRGASALRFTPAKLHDEAIPLTVLFPVYFRHPEAVPLPVDSNLKKLSRPE
jgi:TonB family protein